MLLAHHEVMLEHARAVADQHRQVADERPARRPRQVAFARPERPVAVRPHDGQQKAEGAEGDWCRREDEIEDARDRVHDEPMSRGVEGSKIRKEGKRLHALCSTNTRATKQLERGTPATRSREDDFAVASERGRQASQEKPNRNRVTGHAEDIESTMIAASISADPRSRCADDRRGQSYTGYTDD